MNAKNSPAICGKTCLALIRSIAMLASVMLLVCGLAPASAQDHARHAREFKAQLMEKVMPYWHDTAIDKEYGGYLLADDAKKPARPATEKQLVTQARMVWGFSHAHRKGLGDGKRDYLEAARNGCRFLMEHFLDKAHGGYYWTTDLKGQPLNDRKIIYGQSFVIYALVEFYRAGGGDDALKRAIELYRVLQKNAHDPNHGGWIEHFKSDWTPILAPEPDAIVEVAGLKSANTHLHLMEALTELYDVTQDQDVRASLDEARRINATYFYPVDAGKSCFHRRLDWKPVTDPKSAGLSYGHNVEFAWLMIRAEQVLRRKLSWSHFYAHLDHALKYGYDHELGGLYNRGFDDQPATQTDKIWWVQSEMLAALTDAIKHREDKTYDKALAQLIEFIKNHQADPDDGIWLDTVTADGAPKNTAKAHNWKANYHDLRAIVKFIEAFTPPRSSNQ